MNFSVFSAKSNDQESQIPDTTGKVQCKKGCGSEYLVREHLNKLDWQFNGLINVCNIQWQGIKKTQLCSVMPHERIRGHACKLWYQKVNSKKSKYLFFTVKLAEHFDYAKILGPFFMWLLRLMAFCVIQRALNILSLYLNFLCVHACCATIKCFVLRTQFSRLTINPNVFISP